MALLELATGQKPAAMTSDSAAATAAEVLVRARIRAVVRSVAAVSGSHPDAEHVHQLRVATRRASAAIEGFAPWLEPRVKGKLQRRLKQIRRAAGAVRECDVHLGALEQLSKAAPDEQRPVIRRLMKWTSAEREPGLKRLRRVLESRGSGLRRLARRALDEAEPPPSGATFLDAARPVLEAVRAELRSSASGDLADLAGLHALRLALKHVRYGAELFRPCVSERFEKSIFPALGRAQDVFGAVNDAGEMVAHLDRLGARAAGRPALAGAIHALAARYAAVRDRRHQEALSWWEGFVHGGALEAIEGVLPAPVAGRPRPDPVDSAQSPPGDPPLILPAAAFPTTLFPRRLAAIDVGTNSIRLIVAEAALDGTYRVLDDEKEVVRLGQGMAGTGRLSSEAMGRAAAAVLRMRAIAEGYGVARLRAIGTSAPREAKNAPEFVELIRRTAGVNLEIITAEEEARLAYLSASRAFDLGSIPVAVVDIGGGSTEVVFSAAGVVEEIYTLRLGAVRLTDRFGGPEAAAGDQFRRMRARVRRYVEDRIGRPPFAPQLVVGTGGTFSAAAGIDRARLIGPGSATVQGHELRRSDIRHQLDRLRKLSPRARERFPGLAPDRADIIVPGLTIIDALLRHLRVNRVLVHDRGIRDGLLLTMIRDHLPGVVPAAPARPDPLSSVRRFAAACRYEEAHAEHVARISLSIFDQLNDAAPHLWPAETRPEARLLLEAAAVLHDVGYLINYAGHHKHSYHLIMHADLDGLTGRQIELIANLARYHRRAEPSRRHAAFAKLSRKDRVLVARLAAVLRVADGLDRTHTQGVRSVEVSVDGDTARLIVDATGPAATELWGAQRKDGLFRRALGFDPSFEPRTAAPPA